MKRMIYSAFPEAPRTAYLVASCESGLNQNAKGPTDDHGLFQVHRPTWDKVAKEKGLDYINSIQDNIEMARYIYDQAGGNFRPWVCATSHQFLALY